ncbi:DUF5107 domain-containing protein [Kitasatospora sp. NPDC049285]|uniref:DUF5107 domain-containing protein n=1 Tax=Kitasatospora sp. NPDC049285 TaxID=3157096 RepID=UPI003428DC7E
MTSTLHTDVLRLPAAALPTASPLPLLHGTEVHAQAPGGDPAMTARIAYGQPATLLPYTPQDRYDRDRAERELPTAVLQNEHLTAVFLPTLGGRLWSLVQRPTGRELLHRNPVLQPANLALRNAWFAGGTEWNLGATGHHPLTCAPLHTARTERPDGTPVLRMYEFERMRRLVLQIDAWLPPGAEYLHVQISIHNPGAETVPAYWWSNTAVPERPGTRVLAPADHAFHFDYAAELQRVPFPLHDGTDRSRPAELPYAADYFFDVPDDLDRPWVAAVDPDGTGLLQYSTDRLRGRKLFNWGTGSGGLRWQEWLSGPDSRYLEIQAGLAATQLEHLPLPARTTWTWTEAYGPLPTDPELPHQDWPTAVATLDRRVRALPLDTTPTPPDAPLEPLSPGSGWAALEQAAGALPAIPGLPFPTGDPEQDPWHTLLTDGHLPVLDPPAAPVTGAHWRERLADATDWHALHHLGLLHLAAGDPTAAKAAWHRSLAAARTPWTLRNLAELARLEGESAPAAELLTEAHRLLPTLPELTIETLAALLAAARPADALTLVDALPADQRHHGRIRLLEARAATASGDPARAHALLTEGIEIADLREGEDSLHTLWSTTQTALGKDEPLPPHYDFRMHS